MKFKFIGNAAGIFEGSKGTKILCDPWIVDGVFDGSWYHYPPLETKISDIQNIDAIYVSHIHPDHYDEKNFKFDKDIPVIVLNAGPNFLKKNLINNGYKNIIEVKNDQSIKFNEFKITLFKPFTKHLYEESLIGNLIDSALVLEDDGTTAINFNDNTPDKKACMYLKEKFKKINLALLNYNAAGPYPSCFENLSLEEKKIESNNILKRNFNHLCEIIPILEAKSVLPFAGSYIIGGKNYYKNEFLGTTTWDRCCEYLKNNLKYDCNVFCLRENQTFDVKNLKQLDTYEKIDEDHKLKYIQSLKDNKYDYEYDDMPNTHKIVDKINIAAAKMSARIEKYGIKLKTNVFIEVDKKNIQIIKGQEKDRKLFCKLDLRLLDRILNKKSHWNNAEIGTHINFKREPNKMEPDVHVCLSFFHL